MEHEHYDEALSALILLLNDHLDNSEYKEAGAVANIIQRLINRHT